VSIFPSGLLWSRSTGLCVACWPVSDSLQVRECTEEGENSWKEPCSCPRARRLLVWPVAVTQGKEVSSRRTVQVTEKVYTPGVEHACGE
jgi:hypothetical protein